MAPRRPGTYHQIMTKTASKGRARRIPSPSTSQAFAFVAFALLGLAAAFELLMAELKILQNPDAALACDVNTLIACSSSLLSASAHLLFGVPNSVIGVIAFAALLTLGVLLAARVRFPAWIWWGLGAGTLAGLIYVAFFVWKSLTFFLALCPYCMLTWVSVIGVAVIVWTNLAASGQLGAGIAAKGKTLSRYWPLITVAIYLLIVLLIVVALRQQIATLFA